MSVKKNLAQTFSGFGWKFVLYCIINWLDFIANYAFYDILNNSLKDIGFGLKIYFIAKLFY
jgi:hypothetical protein